MTNYVQTQDAGDIYVRAKSMILNNPKDGVKSVTFSREQIVNLKDSNFIASDLSAIVGNFDADELTKTLTLYHPLTMEKLGEKNIGKLVQQINIWLFSYMVELDKRQQQPSTDAPTI